jgi:transcriptional regulator GlxA family with amidase domain
MFDNFTALDVIGPYEVLSKLPDAKVRFAAQDKGIYRDQHGLPFEAEFDIGEIDRTDLLLIPGGFGIDEILKETEVLDWVRAIDLTTQWTTSVCSGSLLLAAAGLIDGRKCATHWRRMNQLRGYSVEVVTNRYVRDDKYVTSAGVSAGIDMAIYLASLIAGDKIAAMIQAGIEYDPKPPFDVKTIIGTK